MIVRLLMFLMAMACASGAPAFDLCGPLKGAHYGPYDYRTDKPRLEIVEIAHFTPDVESLRRGATSSIGDDLSYTLLASPNHHRALVAMMNLGNKLKTDRPTGAKYSVACYFDRAVRFRPDDGVVRVILANYLSRRGAKEEAAKHLEVARELGPQTPNMFYNMGLAYVEVGDFTKALEFAHLAYAGGFNLPGLKSRLVAAGKWREPTTDESRAAGTAAAASGTTEAPAATPGK